MLMHIRRTADRIAKACVSSQGVAGTALITAGVWQILGLGAACIAAGIVLMFAAAVR